jgi:hypothetical protein
LQIVLDVHTDIIANIGFGLQLNCYSQNNKNIAWQQYFFSLQTANGGPADPSAGILYCYVNNWNVAISSAVVYYAPELILIADSKIAAGSKLSITLGQNSETNDINSVTFVYTDAAGNSHSSILDLPSPGDPSGDVAPIVAFQVNLVGPINAKQAYLWSGAGTITYQAAENLTASSGSPNCGQEYIPTGETANTIYGTLPTGSHSSLTQTFGTVLPPAYAPGGPIAVSQQFNDNVTDVFAIDRAGQLVVFFASGGGHWSSTTGFGPTGLAHQGAALAASQHFGIPNQTDVFLIDQNSQLEYFWVDGLTGTINGPQVIQQQKNGLAPSGGFLAVSQQFGIANQTDVFLVGNNGQLVVLFAQGAGGWGGPHNISNPNFAPNGAPLAVSQQFGIANQTDVFLVGNNGQLVVFYVEGNGNWQGPHAISATNFTIPGATIAVSQQFGIANQTDVFLVDITGQLVVFYVEGNGNWQGPHAISAANFALPGAPVAACQQQGVSNQTDVFVVDITGQLYVFWVVGNGPWNGPEKIGPVGMASPFAILAASPQFGASGQTDLFVVNQTGTNAPGWPVVCWVDNGGQWNGPKALVTES